MDVPVTRDLASDLVWPQGGVTRVPFRVFSDPEIYAEEQKRLFRGPIWNFLCLEIEISNPGDWRLATVGETPIVVTRDEHGVIHALVNRCAHKGALVCLQERGNAKALTCVYHSWSYDLAGRLQSVAFRHGVRGKGGMPEDFDNAQHRLEPLRVEVFSGLVFGTFSDETKPVEEYLGETMARMIRRNLGRPHRLLGMHSQIIHNNWKLYAENVRDSYHATLLHTFYTTFKVNRLDMDGGMLLSDDGRHSISYAKRDTLQQSDEYQTGAFGTVQIRLGRAATARHVDRVRRRHHPLHPDDIPDTGRAADAEFAGGAVLHAARHRQDRTVLDLPRLSGRQQRADTPAPDAEQPDRCGGIGVARGWLHQRIRPAWHARQRGPQRVPRDGRSRCRVVGWVTRDRDGHPRFLAGLSRTDGLLTVREAIEELLADYAEAIDDGALERWPGFFTEDGEYQIITRESHDAGLPIGILYCGSRGMMEDRIQALRTANIYEPHSYRHLLGRPRYEQQSDGFAVRSDFCVFRIAQDGDTVTFATGRYLDRVVQDDGTLRFRSRHVVLDSAAG